MPEFDHRAVQAALRSLLRRHRALLDAASIEHVEGYAGQEEEMALESLCLDLMGRPEVPLVDLEEMARLCDVVGLDRESVYDPEFWAHFREALEARRATDVASLDRLLRQQAHLDCELEALVDGALTIRVGPDLRLRFEDVRFVGAPRAFRLDPTRPALRTLSEAGEARCSVAEAELRLDFGIGGAHAIHEMPALGLEVPVRIAAASVRRCGAVREPSVRRMAHVLEGAEAIDPVLRAYPWLDCEPDALVAGTLTVSGGVDLHGPPPDLHLQFEGVEHLHAPSDWKTDTTQPVLVRLPEDEAATLRRGLGLNPAVQVFEMRCEDRTGRCRIAARSVRLTQTRTPDAPLKLPW